MLNSNFFDLWGMKTRKSGKEEEGVYYALIRVYTVTHCD